MPFAINDEVRIHYEVEGNGEPLIMIDGFSTPLEMWREEGHSAALASGHRLILIDVRGHGQSGKPQVPEAYRPDLLAGDVLAVLRDVGEVSAHYLGASMGAAIGFEVARRAPETLRSLVVFGYGRYGPPSEQQRRFQAIGRQLEETAVAMGATVALAALERIAGPRPPRDRERFLANDHQGLLALLQAMEEWPGFEDELPGLATPALFLLTEGDPFYEAAKACAEAMPRASFVTLPGGAHAQSAYDAASVTPHVLRFLAEVEARARDG
jgi:pimeloyl-ACP methyl ester carboxylesterase